MRQLATLGGCTRPIRLAGHRTEHRLDTTTGEIGPAFHHLDSNDLPAGDLLVRCGNRRTTRCPACAETYRRDTYHLITAGLRGGKGTPEQVTSHPRVFATFTAPSFGPVHNRPTAPGGRTRPCRCGRHHDQDDALLGTPLAPDRYDYEAAVLWNAHAGMLWRRFTIYLRREIARRAGLTQREFAQHARVSFAKVAEYQKRGAVHFHAVIRLDGPTGGDTPPPPWAGAELLTDGPSAPAKTLNTSACAPGPTCSASAATSPPKPAATPPPSAPSARPVPNGAASNPPSPAATPHPSPTTRRTSTTRRLSSSPTGPTPEPASPPPRNGSPPRSQHPNPPPHRKEWPHVTDELLTVPEVMKRLKLGRSTVYDLIRSHRLVSITIGRSRRVPASALHEFIHHQIAEAA